MNRARFLIVHGVRPVHWAMRYDIDPVTRPCSDCDRALTTRIPFAIGQMRGLLAPQCECGNKNTPYCVVRDPRYGDLLDGALAGRGGKGDG